MLQCHTGAHVTVSYRCTCHSVIPVHMLQCYTGEHVTVSYRRTSYSGKPVLMVHYYFFKYLGWGLSLYCIRPSGGYYRPTFANLICLLIIVYSVYTVSYWCTFYIVIPVHMLHCHTCEHVTVPYQCTCYSVILVHML